MEDVGGDCLMTWVVGAVASEPFALPSLATGQTFTRSSSKIANADVTWNPTFSEVGNGVYRYVYTPSAAGSHEWVGTATNGEIVIVTEPHVITPAQADPATALADASTGVKASILNATTAGASDGTVLGALLRIGRGTAYVTAPVAETTAVEVRQGDDYLNADGRALEWATDAAGDWPTLTDATVAFTAEHVYGSDTFTKAATVVTATGATKLVRVELTADETTGLQSGRWTYTLVATLANASVVTLAAHRMTVHERIG